MSLLFNVAVLESQEKSSHGKLYLISKFSSIEVVLTAASLFLFLQVALE